MTTADRTAPRPGVLERAATVMDVFAYGRHSASLDDVTADTGLPRSTTFRILQQLVALEWLEHGPAGYRLGRRAAALNRTAVDYSTLRAAAADPLADLNMQTGGVCHLGVLEGRFVHYLDKVGGPANRSIPSRVGAQLAADETVSGQVLLAGMQPEDVDRLMGGGALCSSVGGPGAAGLHDRLNRVRAARGVAFSFGDRCTIGISSVAAAVMGPHGPVASISVAARRAVHLESLAPVVVAAATATSASLFPDLRRRR
ncbi:IclR family transcriptional regulator [Gordonia neofelifaecis]|uniref:IclR family transcriptional regulator n=1 Tax=Gordonia neofelifaecis NRRL B-59395 TaxID=644548 RepID=F1YNU6_9ACTN|nr:helix-turn-helix domain-containing protein [Gordonia neofelifaecis]EGD53565.1 IclR family transcriptional regulator [Gordonia neofelifaecis NRRL B-59395]